MGMISEYNSKSFLVRNLQMRKIQNSDKVIKFPNFQHLDSVPLDKINSESKKSEFKVSSRKASEFETSEKFPL